MSSWLRRLTTLLVLTLASVCVDAPARAWEVETAHRGFTAAIGLAATEIAALSASHVREKSLSGWQATSDLLIYAYGSPTVYVDPTGRAGFLTDLRDRLNETDDILREWAAESDGTLGFAAASAGRALVNVGSVPSRLLNLASDYIAQSLPGEPFEGVAEQGSIEFGQTVDATAYAISHPIDTGAALHAAAVDTTSRTIGGERGAASDMFTFGVEALTGSGIGKKIAQNMGRNVANRSTTVVEGANGKPAMQFNDPDVVRDLDQSIGTPPTLARNVAPDEVVMNSGGDRLIGTMGPARVRNAAEYEGIVRDLENNGVEISYRQGQFAYGPAPSGGRPGNIVFDPDASLSAIKHEYGHFLDDQANGFPGQRYYYENPGARVGTERSQYLQEIRTARELGDNKARRELIHDYLGEKKYLIENYYMKPYGSE